MHSPSSAVALLRRVDARDRRIQQPTGGLFWNLEIDVRPSYAAGGCGGGAPSHEEPHSHHRRSRWTPRGSGPTAIADAGTANSNFLILPSTDSGGEGTGDAS